MQYLPWVPLTDSADSEDKDGAVYYYDKDSIKRESGIVRVWTEDKYNEKNERWSKWVKLCKENKNIYETESINDCDRFSYRKKLFEINCKKNTSRIISETMYDENGDYLSYMDTPTDPWDLIVSGSIEDKLKNRVCK